MLLHFVGGLLMVICVLVSIAFLTLLERKVLGYIQIRKGPNKVGYMGLIQPFSDAIKLFTKEQTMPTVSNYYLYLISPVMGLLLALLIWSVFPYWSYMCSFNYGIMFFLCVSSMGVYSIMIAGWASNSNYALLGSLRAVAQTISYEVSMALLVFSLLVVVQSLSLMSLIEHQEFIWFIFLFPGLFMMWFASCLAETNRTPFDFAEGESELVSGFNVEYSSGGFALIFLAEYGMILFMSMLMVVLFLGCDTYSFFFFLSMSLLAFSFIWARGTLPRYRYDKLMSLAWSSFLPVALNMIIFFGGLSLII
uniref:NADH-ubiquinone oxidoreductase chain 1 n=1 Tax=Mirhipipteryx andensis TaxID=1564103 RepID=A0A0N7AS59_9ORTH|nr:NADH dehydrogenase subunit 1 [Mirhipipteryx andensis]AJW76432.1 NADH dehydrogenase subunit 1 [Mirhipipteryx andensis]